MRTLKVSIDRGKPARHPSYATVGSLAGPRKHSGQLPLVAALVNNEVSSLSYPLTVDSSICFLTVSDSHGWRVYRNSMSFLLAKATTELFPHARFAIQNSLGTGIYCSIEIPSSRGARNITAAQLLRLDRRIRDLVAKDLPIERVKLSYAQAVKRFRSAGHIDKLNLLKFRNPPRIVVHSCDGFIDLAHTPLAPSTGVLRTFRLIHYPPGFILQLPDRARPATVAPYKDQPPLFAIFQEHKEWGRILNVTTAGRLNEIIASGEISEFIKIAEALHEKKVSHIADRVLSHKDRIRIILVAGPSCAGKTTFSKRLSIHLRVNGLRPLIVSTDDYFVDERSSPRDKSGNFDFEHIDAVDVPLFNRQLVELMKGNTVNLPQFDFESRKRSAKTRPLQLADDQILIIEGIHGLNPKLTHRVPAKRKMKIYVSALTQLALDANNRISTTDNRLMRRIVRDSQFRGNSPLQTLRMWPSVRSGEKKWIFPFQRHADATFNSALDYELAILKPIVEPLLLQIKSDSPEYAEARRLAAFLSNFLSVADTEVPKTSILREYIGQSAFSY
ncbi:MAG: nucleoside kinase [Lentisphaerales bacterium]|nr:MAG: nucleoside kinase [Lentisphaerales bacterium]